jgi:hypothetical protein
VFDNCEHVLDAAAELIEAILAHSATVRKQRVAQRINMNRGRHPQEQTSKSAESEPMLGHRRRPLAGHRPGVGQRDARDYVASSS